MGQEIAGVSPAEARGLLTDVPPSVGDGLAVVADIQKVLRRDLRHLTGSDQDERVDDHLEKAMENYEELRQVEKDHREMMDQFLSCLLYTSPSPRDRTRSRMPSSA